MVCEDSFVEATSDKDSNDFLIQEVGSIVGFSQQRELRNVPRCKRTVRQVNPGLIQCRWEVMSLRILCLSKGESPSVFDFALVHPLIKAVMQALLL